jgi:uncharacterized protein
LRPPSTPARLASGVICAHGAVAAIKPAFFRADMFQDIAAGELTALVIGLLISGVLTGLLAGVFGVGGGAIVVPVLYEFFRIMHVPEDVRMPLAVGTSLAVIIPTSIRSFMAHRSKEAVDISILRLWAVPVVAGVLLGAVVARFAPASLFKLVFVVIAGLSAFRLLFGKDNWRLGDQLPAPWITRGYGVVVGLLSSLMGVGGGQLSTMFMTFYGRPIHQAVATSSGIGVLISIPGALGYVYAGWPRMDILPPYSLGFVSFIGVLVFVPMSILAAPIGVTIAHRLSKRRLETAFGIFLAIVSLRFLWSLIA